MIKGKNCLLYIGNDVVAASRELSVSRSTDVLEVCSPTSGANKEFIPTTQEWSASISGLVSTESGIRKLRNAYRTRAKIRIKYTLGEEAEEGFAIITSLEESGSVSSLSTWSMSLKGTGALIPTEYAITDFTDLSYDERHIDGVIINSSDDYEFDEDNGSGIWAAFLDIPTGSSVRKLICETSFNYNGCVIYEHATINDVYNLVRSSAQDKEQFDENHLVKCLTGNSNITLNDEEHYVVLVTSKTKVSVKLKSV